MFEAIREAVADLVVLADGDRAFSRDQSFTENGGAFYYEMVPHAVQGGLLEVATPECRGPTELLLYQRAQERLFQAALPGARKLLANLGHPGEIGLLKNCRDAFDHVYGPQENYEVDIGSGPALWGFRAGVTALLPLVFLTSLVYLPLAVVLMVTMFGMAITVGLAEAIAAGSERIEGHWMNRTLSAFGHVWMSLETLVTAPMATPALLLLRATAFLPQRRALLAHLISRPIYIGAGTWRNGTFGLDEKAPAIRRTTRWTVLPQDRAVFEMGNLVKMLSAPMLLRPSRLLKLYRRRQRFQLGLSASNMAQHAEYLKVGTTGLLLDLAEAGALRNAPRLRRPIRALHRVITDPTLTAVVETNVGPLSALELQRWYLARADEALRIGTVSLEAREVVARWKETLDLLERDPEALVGRVDWITKRTLIDAGRRAGLEEDALKKIDLRYHELGEGYFAELEGRGLVEALVSPEAIDAAIRRPPEDTPATVRAKLLRRLRDDPRPLRVAWDRVTLGGRFGGTVVRLDDYRRPRPSD